MKLRKMLAIGLTTASVAALTALTVNAAGTKVAKYDFEGDNSSWYNGGEGNGTTITNVEKKDVTENGNTFRRLEFDVAGAAQAAQLGSVLEFPASSITLPEAVTFEDGQIIKISSKIRSNQVGSNARILAGIAMNVPEKAYKKDVITSLTGGVHGWNKFFNNLYKIDYSSGSKIAQSASGASQWGATAGLNWGAYCNTPNTDYVSTALSANTWYKVDTYLMIEAVDGVNKIAKVRTVVNDGDMGDVTTVVNSNTKYGSVLLGNETDLKSLHLYTAFRNESGATFSKADITVDFDDIKVIVYDSAEDLKTTSLKWDFEGDNSDWYNGGEDGSGSSYTVSNVEKKDVTENGNTFRRLKLDMQATAADTQVGDVRHMPSSTIVLDEPIKFEDGQVIKISSKVRNSQLASSYRLVSGMAMNVPEKAYKKDVIASLTGGVHAWNKKFNNLYNIDYSSGSKVYHSASGNSQWGATAGLNWGAYWNIPNSDQVSTVNLSANKWYKVDSYLTIGTVNGKAVITKVRTRVNDGTLGDVETVVNSNTQYGNVSLANETSLKSLHLYTAWRSPAGEIKNATVDFDDVEITVLDSSYDTNELYYIHEDYKTSENVWQIARNWGTDQSAHYTKTTMTVANGVVRIDGTDTGNNGQYDLVGLHRAMPKAITLSADKDFVIKARVRNTCDSANLQFMVNRGTAYNVDWLQGKNRYNTLLDISTNGISLRGKESSVVPGWKDFHSVYSGSTLNKWFDVEFYFDSSDKTIYGCVTDEEGNVYSLVSATDWEKTEILSFSWVMYDINDDKDAEGNTVYAPVSFELASFDFYEVSNDQWLKLTDEEGNEINGINAGDKVCASYKFKPDAGDIIKYYAMVALYSEDENGALKLEQVEVRDLGMNMGYYDGITDAITIPEGDDYVVKAFLWNSATNKPMMVNDEI